MDPRDPTPVKVVKRGDAFVIVDAGGKKLADGDEYADEAKARADAAVVNRSWAAAKSQRKAKGAPAVTEAKIARTEAILFGIDEAGLLGKFKEILHPRGRAGKFRADAGRYVGDDIGDGRHFDPWSSDGYPANAGEKLRGKTVSGHLGGGVYTFTDGTLGRRSAELDARLGPRGFQETLWDANPNVVGAALTLKPGAFRKHFDSDYEYAHFLRTAAHAILVGNGRVRDSLTAMSGDVRGRPYARSSSDLSNKAVR